MEPCPCMPLRQGVKILATFDVMFSVVNVGLLILSWLGLLADHQDLELDKETKILAIVVFALGMIACLFQIVLTVILFRGVKNHDHRSCRIWLLMTIGMVVFAVGRLIGNFISRGFDEVTFGVSVISFGYKAYEMFVVFTFMGELANTGGGGFPTV